MIWAIAVRNLWQHKAKTIIIGFLVTVGIMLSFAGNAFIDSMIKNISGIFTEYYTGDVLITSAETLGAGVFGAESDDTYGFPVTPVMKDYDKVLEIAQKTPGVKSVTRQLSGYAMLNVKDTGGMTYACFFGVEPEYFDVMTGIEILQGRKLKAGEEGMLLHYNIWKKIKDEKGIELKIGDTISLNNFGTGGLKIREVPIVGIFKFPRGNERMFSMSFMDATSLRYLLGRNSGTREKVEVAKSATSLLDTDMDSLFADSSADTATQVTSGKASATVNAGNVFDILGDAKPAPAPADQPVSWHYILIHTDKGVNPDTVVKTLNKTFDDNDLLVRAQGWWVSAMPDSLTYSGIKLLFNVAIFILGFVSIIIIMNTLVVSVMERTSEIGTMRALGAQKSFVMKMFIAETGFITLVFGLIGMALGAIIILALNRIGISTDNDALRYLGGGGVLRPVIGSSPIILSLCFMGLIASVSWIYPVIIALKVSPLKAITTE
jgi:putative ABC transport system permease protein